MTFPSDKPKYKIVTTSGYGGTVEWVWESKEDALACRDLLKKAASANGAVLHVVEFTEPRLVV